MTIHVAGTCEAERKERAGRVGEGQGAVHGGTQCNNTEYTIDDTALQIVIWLIVAWNIC